MDKYGLIRKINRDITLSCQIAKVSCSGYYKWLKNSDNEERDYQDYLLIKDIFDKYKSKYGWRSIKMKLLENNIIMNHKKISRIMRKYSLITKIRRINPYKSIMKKSQEHRTFDNKLNREFQQIVPYKTFCTDITYIIFNRNIAYLSAVKDIASREVVGHHLSKNLRMDIVFETINNLKNNVKSLDNIMIHSDQGFHYTSPQYINTIKELNMIQSMSRKGNCIDNAPIESFFGHFKDDVDYKECKTFDELSFKINEYVRYYNQERRQWKLKKMTPVEYRNHLLTLK
jgi:transposase InsO family protein